jgi:hypothetical protein
MATSVLCPNQLFLFCWVWGCLGVQGFFEQNMGGGGGACGGGGGGGRWWWWWC